MVRVDASKTYQTVTGFGVTVPYHLGVHSSVYNHDFFDALINDLGCSIIRTTFLTQDTETPDPDLLNIQLGDFSDLVTIKPDLKVIASIASPPGTMRDGTGRLRPESREAFGRYLFNMCDAFEQRGCPIYGLGLQNGPTTGYSCVYDRETYYEMFKTLSQLKSQRGSSVRLLATEDNFCVGSNVMDLVDRINADPVVKDYLDFLGVQGHMDMTWGDLMRLRMTYLEAVLKDAYKDVCLKFNSTVSPFGKYLWMIESCHEDRVWKVARDYSRTISIRDPMYHCVIQTAAMDIALKINSSLVYGGFSSYVYWFASSVAQETLDPNVDLKDPSKTLCINGEKTFKYQVAKHFFKYVLPGMSRVDVVSDGLEGSAFTSDKVVVVLINDKDTIVEDSVEFAGANVSKFTSYTSVENEYHHEESGVVSGNKVDVVMLPNSIATFIVE